MLKWVPLIISIWNEFHLYIVIVKLIIFVLLKRGPRLIFRNYLVVNNLNIANYFMRNGVNLIEMKERETNWISFRRFLWYGSPNGVAAKKFNGINASTHSKQAHRENSFISVL